jgi:hypothetical protein
MSNCKSQMEILIELTRILDVQPEIVSVGWLLLSSRGDRFILILVVVAIAHNVIPRLRMNGVCAIVRVSE